MHQRRIIITLLGGIAYLVAIMCALTMIVAAIGLLELNFATPRQWVDGMRDLLRDDGWLRFAAIFSSVLAGSQAIFLLPIFRFRPPRGARGTSLKVSIILAGFIAAGIVVAIMAALAELFAVLIAAR